MREQTLEENFIVALQKAGYQRFNGHDHGALKENLRLQLERLNNVRFTDIEYESLYLTINSGNEYARADRLRQPIPIELECNNNETVYIKLLNKSWCDNLFQVGSQIRTTTETNSNRFDVTLLVNGLPLVQIELKKLGMALSNAVNQIKGYKNKGAYTNLFRYLQLFVVSNKANTRYFANPGNESINPEFVFQWMDVNNNHVNDLFELTTDFFKPCNLTRIIGEFMVIQPENKVMKVMRPYQIHAVKALLAAVEAGPKSGNRYVWHPTGSGKTLTCFKTAKLVSEMRDGDNNAVVDKVLFLTDRRDLDAQGVKAFKEYDQNLLIDEVDNTRELVKHINDVSRHLIPTTIQKLHNVIKYNPTALASWRDKRVLILVDECHRTQFGAMHAQIIDYFRNVQMFGFTGTPIFSENSNGDRTTEYIFNTLAHEYNISQAIRDKAVLPFSFQEETIKIKNPNVDSTLKDIYKSDTWKKQVVENILKNHSTLTQNRKYSGMLTVSSIPEAIEYYRIFSDKRKNGLTDLKVATIFSFNPGDEETKQADLTQDALRAAVSATMRQFNHDFETAYTLGEYDTYKKEVAVKLTNVELDLVIVVDMLTTGFDAPKLNTVYVDKDLRYHRLLQTFARSNRVLDASKTHGNIVTYRAGMRDNMDETLRLYGGGAVSSDVCIPALETLLEEFREAVTKLKEVAPTVQSVDLLKSEVDVVTFLKTFSETLALSRRIEQYVGFSTLVEASSFEKVTSIKQDTFDEYHSKYKDLRDSISGTTVENENSSLLSVDFEFVDGDRTEVNYDYIFNLTTSVITKLLPNDPAAYEAECEKLVAAWAKDEMDLSSEHKSAALFAEFLLVAPDLLSDVPVTDRTDVLRSEWSKFIENKIETRLTELSNVSGLDKVTVESFYEQFVQNFGRGLDQSLRRDLKESLKGSKLKPKLVERNRLVTTLLEEFENIYRTFNHLILEETL